MTAPGELNLSSPEVRAREADIAAVCDVYGHYVLHSPATFEETAPTLGDMLARRRACVDLGLPYRSRGERRGRGVCVCGPLSLAPGLSLRHGGSVRPDGTRHRLCAARRTDRPLRARTRGRWSRSSVTAPIRLQSRCIGASVSNLSERCDRSASSTDDGSTRQSCSEVCGMVRQPPETDAHFASRYAGRTTVRQGISSS